MYWLHIGKILTRTQFCTNPGQLDLQHDTYTRTMPFKQNQFPVCLPHFRACPVTPTPPREIQNHSLTQHLHSPLPHPPPPALAFQ